MNESIEGIYLSGSDLKNLKLVLDYLLEVEESDYKEHIAKDFEDFLSKSPANYFVSRKEFYKKLNSGHIYETVLHLMDNIFHEDNLDDDFEEEDLSGCQRKEQHSECYGVLWQCSKCEIIICCAEGTDSGDKVLDNLCDNCWAEEVNKK